MRKILSSVVNRRKFLKSSLLGTGFVFSGNVFPGLINVNTHTASFESADRSEGIFPFYPYIDDYNFGEFIPKDQGGKFVQMELIGSEDDRRIAEIVKNGLLRKNLGNPADWSIFEKTELEKSVWFNRFYYLPSFARLYYLDKNKSHLEPMMEILTNWIKENPPSGPSKSKYNWFDMQVAWRSINLSWCYYLGKDGLTNTDKELIYNLQGEHAKILMKDFGHKELNEFNHQSHGALAILYLALLFPSLPESQMLLQTGLKIIKHHVDHAFYNDGGNVEQMFGYYPFMTSIIRDAYLLCLANNEGDPQHSIPLMKKMYVFLSEIAQPDNTVPAINDSYEETITFIIPTLTKIIGKENLPELKRTTIFRDSQIGVIRSAEDSQESWYINLNAAKLIGSHDHAGRLAFNVWHNNKAILVDSGCCNYDNHLLVDWYRTSEAHNTVLIDGKSDFATSQKDVQWVAKRYTENVIKQLDVGENYKFCRMVSPENDETNNGVRWTRDIVLIIDKYLIVHDFFESDSEHTYDTIFRFADIKVSQSKSGNRLMIDSGEKLILMPASRRNSETVTLKNDFLGSHAKNIKTPTSVYHFKEDGNLHTAFLLKAVDNNSEIEKIKFSQIDDGIRCELKLVDEYNQNLKATFVNDNVETQSFILTLE
ncbi:MAG: alginate lyase family protein [Calditrichae bacterium]|nr:alginate lyase family protein [Calditrichota bacterium]MCB9059026.1 alginate lyase family protein [Calditrichia bacterium]